MSQRQVNETNTPVEKFLTKEEIGILYDFLKHEYVTYSNEPLYELMKKISRIANEKASDCNHSR